MKLAFVLLSPREDGASARLLKFIENRLPTDAEINTFSCNRQNETLPDLSEYDRILLSAPVYINALPGSTSAFLQNAELSNRHKGKPVVYFLSNCGFSEGENNLISMGMIRNWCARCGFRYAYSVGFGTGPRLFTAPDAQPSKGFKNRCKALPETVFRKLASYDGALFSEKAAMKVLEQLVADIENGTGGRDLLLRPWFPKTVFLNNRMMNLWFFLKTHVAQKTD